MTIRQLAFYIILLISPLYSFSQQTGYFDEVTDRTNWVENGSNSGYTISLVNNTEVKVNADSIVGYQIFLYNFPTLDISNKPYLQLNIKSSANVNIRIDFQDANGKVTNGNAVSNMVAKSNSYSTFTYDFTGRFNQTYPSPSSVDPTQIKRLLIYFNPGTKTPFYGDVYFDSVRIGTQTNIPPPPKLIKFNQIGFYTSQPKIAIAAGTVSDSFFIVSSNKQDTVYKGIMAPAKTYTLSGETVRKIDFSSLMIPGRYYISVDSGYSYPFDINDLPHHNLSKGLIKSYYYNRASTDIPAEFGGVWARAKGHPDNVVYVHSSAATSGRPTNTIFSSPRGWYDAGDYNKYVVNSGITTYTVQALYEHFPAFFDTLNLNIPESNNNVPDVLDEALWNVRWLLTAQDPTDGSVYHKISSLNFDGTEMPASDHLQRFGIQRSTAAALDFTAVMAQSYRIYSQFETEFPGFADSCLNAAIKAYEWALANPNILVTGNVSGVSTGDYPDSYVNDNFDWANMELYAATRDDKYYSRNAILNGTFNPPSRHEVNTLGLITLNHYRKQLNIAGYADTTFIKNKLLSLANYLKTGPNNSPYNTVMGITNGNYSWGGNATAGNQAFVLIQAFRLTSDTTYLRAALTNLDYVLGRNGTGYSFVTGFGSKYPLHPHHRMSEADGAVEPVPGMVVGGPNINNNGTHADNCTGYPTSYAASSYLDTYCSYSTNEPAIDYTAPIAYLSNAIEASLLGANYIPEYTAPPTFAAVTNKTETKDITLYPVPAQDELYLEFETDGKIVLEILNSNGQVMTLEETGSNDIKYKKINVSNYPKGFYILTITSDEGTFKKKFIIQ